MYYQFLIEMRDQMDDPLEKDIEKYHNWVLFYFYGHPITALKVHTMQFGGILGAVLGILSTSSFYFAEEATLVAVFGLLLFAFGIDIGNAFTLFSKGKKVTIATRKIRLKPHYFVYPLLFSYLLFRSMNVL